MYPQAYYPSNEAYSDLPEDAFRQALLDPNMLEPASINYPAAPNPQFPTNLFRITMGGDAGIFGGNNQQVTVPLTATIISIGASYGDEIGYAGDVYKDTLIMIPFSVWTNTGSTQDDVKARFDFIRGHRYNVFGQYNLDLQNGQVNARPRPKSPIDGLFVVDYRWRFRYSRS